MATGMHMDKRNVDCLVLGHHDQDRKVSAKSVTMRAMTLCKNLSGYRELLLNISHGSSLRDIQSLYKGVEKVRTSHHICRHAFAFLARKCVRYKKPNPCTGPRT